MNSNLETMKNDGTVFSIASSHCSKLCSDKKSNLYPRLWMYREIISKKMNSTSTAMYSFFMLNVTIGTAIDITIEIHSKTND